MRARGGAGSGAMADSHDDVLRVENLCVDFSVKGRQVRILSDISFSLRRGETLGIIGESGCGKSMTALALLRMVPSPPGRITALRERADAAPGNYQAQLALGRALFAAREWEEARAALERAVELVPLATGFDSPHGLLARIAQEQGDRESAMQHLERLLAHDETSLEAVRLLAALAEETTDEARMRSAYDRLLEIDPFDPIPHQALGRLAMAGGRHDAAIREFDVALALGPVDRVVAHSDYAESLLAAGDVDGARRQALAALEIAPTYERAQELLLQAVERRP